MRHIAKGKPHCCLTSTHYPDSPFSTIMMAFLLTITLTLTLKTLGCSRCEIASLLAFRSFAQALTGLRYVYLPDGKEATVSHSFMKLKLQSSQPTLSYRVGIFVIVIVGFRMQRYEIRLPSLSAITSYGMLQRKSFEKICFFFLSTDNKYIYACIYGQNCVTL